MRSEGAGEPPAAFRLALIGLPGTGKTRVGRELARVLACEFQDSDAAVEAAAGCSIPDLVAREGWPAFRACERTELAAALARDGIVIATGGGAVEEASNRREIARRATFVVWLRAPLALILERIGVQTAERPLLAGEPAAALAELSRRRDPWYAQLADLEIDTGGEPPQALARRIAAALGETGGAG